MSRTLRLTLTKHWFDMFKSGYKIEELREIKPYWVSRLCKNYSNSIMTNSDVVDNQYTEGGDNTNGWRFGSGIVTEYQTLQDAVNGIHPKNII